MIEGNTPVYNDFQGLSALRSRAQHNPEAELEQVASQFESLFVQMMLKSMRDATMEGGLFESSQLDTYQGMFDQQIALDIAGKGGIGLADMMVQQMRTAQGYGLKKDAEPELPAAAPLHQVTSAVQRQFLIGGSESKVQEISQPAGPQATEVLSAKTPLEFVEQLQAEARTAARELGVNPDTLIAQSALETGWGQHIIRDSAGRSSNNLFNIKANSQWQGETVTVDTTEYRDGSAVKESATFKVYDSMRGAFDDYVALIKGSDRYSSAREKAADSGDYLRGLQNGGYATDPAYADKVLAVLGRIAGEGLKQWAQ